MLKQIQKKRSYLLIIVLLLAMLPSQLLQAASLKLSYDGKSTTYTGAQVKYTLDGKSISSKYPGIIENGIALAPAYDIFNQSKIKAKYEYNASNKTVTISKDKTVIKMKLGSKTVEVNGKKRTSSVAPKLVTFQSSKVKRVMVPSRFVAENLGYQYRWNSSTSTVAITTQNSQTTVKPPSNLGSSGSASGSANEVILPTDNYKEAYTPIIDKSLDAVSGSGTEANITLIERDDDMATGQEIYSIRSDVPFGAVTSSVDEDGILRITTQGSTYEAGIGLGGLVKKIDAITEEGNANISVTLPNAKTRYALTLSADSKVLTLSVFPDYFTGLTVTSSETSEIISLTTLMELGKIQLVEDSDQLIIDFPDTENSFSEQTKIVDGTYLKGIQCTRNDKNGSRIILTKSSKASYSVSTKGNVYTVSLSMDENNSTGDNNSNGSESTESSSVQIPLPDGVSSSDISDEDLYLKKTFTITIPGDHTSFYNSNPIAESHSAITDISVSLNSAGNTVITVKTSKIQGYKIKNQGKSLVVTVANPSKIYKNIIALDAGHGGTDPGASANGTKEKDLTYKILYTYAKEYFDAPDSEIKAYYTRTTDVFESLDYRASFAKEVEADIFISLHMNSASSSANGTEVYYSTSNNSANTAGLTSSKMASMFQESIYKAMNTTNRGVKTAKFVVVHKNTVPAVLIELGFLSGSSDYKKLVDSTYQKKVAKAIYDTSLQVFQQFPTGR